MGHEQSVCKLKEYVDALEKERRKIEVFERELPLCMQLITHAIEGCKQQMMGSGERLVSDGPSDCEVTSNEEPVLEEFIPLKRSSEEEDGKRDCTDADETSFAGEKPDWLRSVQLWNHDDDPPSKQERISVFEPNKSNGAFHPFCRDDKVNKPAASSTAESGGTTNENVSGRTGQRKTRRCWSPELHRRFLLALEQLGGSRAATPKQIKESMKVDGLTNDEVKSHLQKYRLHNRRPGHAAKSESTGDAQAPQFVVVGGIWVPPPEYSQATGQPPAAWSGRQGTKVYAPRARFPSSRRRHGEVHSAGSGGRTNSGESPATSTSSHVTATSPAA